MGARGGAVRARQCSGWQKSAILVQTLGEMAAACDAVPMVSNVLDALIELRRNYGLTLGHINEAGQPLMDALGTSDANVVRTTVAEAIAKMGRARHVLVLLASYGLDVEGGAVTTLTARQGEIARSLGISVDTVKRDERRAIGELHRLLFPGDVTVPSGVDASDLFRRYMNAIEYVDLDAHSGQASLDVVASNHYGNNGAHISGTPTDEEWNDEHFRSCTTALRNHAAELIRCLAGWSSESLMRARPSARPLSSGRASVIQSIDSTQEIVHDDWKSISALLHLRRWQMFRDVDDGLIDLYISPSRANPWDGYTREVRDDAVVGRLMDLRDQILLSVTGIVREILQDPELTLACNGVIQWEEEGTPVTGADSYRLRLLIADDL